MAAAVVVSLLTTRPSVAATVVPPSDALEDAGRLAMELIESRPNDYTGAEIDGTSNRLTVSLPAGDRLDERKDEVLRLLSDTHTAPQVDFVIAKYSHAALDQYQDRIMADATRTNMESVTAVGEDPILGVPIVYLDEVTDATRGQVQDAFGSDIQIEQGDSAEPAATRRLDPAPHYGGAGYRRWNVAHTVSIGECSIGFPVVTGTQRWVLTAGHCMPGQTAYSRAYAELHSGTSGAYYFGGLSTTTISGTPGDLRDGNQDYYGDWALLNGSTYSPILYSGAIDSSATLIVGAVNYKAAPRGSQVCSSGRTTAKRCRLFVTVPDMRMRLKRNAQGDTIWVARITKVRSDQNLDGFADCSGWAGGDSGGPIFQGISGHPAYARAMGIVTASGKTLGICNYFFTRLSGVKSWNPNAQIQFRAP